MKGKIKKYVALVLSVQQLLCGCSATELEDRCFPMMAVVDEKDGQISFGYGFPKLSQKDNTDLEEARVNIAPVTGKTMESCVQTYDSRLEKLADCNHMKVLVFGENLMEDTGRYAQKRQWIFIRRWIRRNSSVLQFWIRKRLWKKSTLSGRALLQKK